MHNMKFFVLLFAFLVSLQGFAVSEQELQFYIKQRLRIQYEELETLKDLMTQLENETNHLLEKLRNEAIQNDGGSLDEHLKEKPTEEFDGILQSEFIKTEKGFLPTMHQNILSHVINNKIGWIRHEKSLGKLQ